MSDRIKSLLFAACLCFVCSILLTTASAGLQRFQERNIVLDKQNQLRSGPILISQCACQTVPRFDTRVVGCLARRSRQNRSSP